MTGDRTSEPDGTAVRTALWRAPHVQADAPPHVFEDEIGLRLVAPGEGRRSRPDMEPRAASGFRAAVVARARFIEDLVAEQAALGVTQYVVRGAGLDTFAQRRPEIASRLRVLAIDQPGTQAWKRRRLAELGYDTPGRLHFVPVDFEAGESWLGRLAGAGFDARRPAVVVSTGVTMYLTRDATAATLREIVTLAPGSTLAMTFLLPAEHLDASDRPGQRASQEGARSSGTPFISFYAPRRHAVPGPRGRSRGRPARGGQVARRPLLRPPAGRPAPVDRRGLPAGCHPTRRVRRPGHRSLHIS
ncbi:S-adenosyl-L-methionine-dependent methyltransferase [Streptomyces naganishii JCM 4654]|uniref:S-adenosyl-L-methionine-dependent methyltransferase n=1 Tax=Streptomyces naganishii JCM 4654 TaxID=1306179 RepID=A0A918Y6T2_9ACTN|nr:S-adenosyl-L-methionine-dependent methyltransferase [Streptomyces naganishii JCM 4654]